MMMPRSVKAVTITMMMVGDKQHGNIYSDSSLQTKNDGHKTASLLVRVTSYGEYYD